jgi:FkbM family methyltransferase
MRSTGLWRNALWTRLGQYFLYTGAEVEVSTIFGSRMRVRTDDFVQKHIAVFGQWEPAITSYLSAKLGPKDVFLDVGANVGYYSLLAAKKGATVHAIEASPTIARRLRTTLDADNATQVALHECAVAAESGELEFFRAPDTALGMSSLIWSPGFTSEGKVPAKPLSEIVGKDVLASATFIKIDVEGVEPAVIDDILANETRADVELLVEFNPTDPGSSHHASFDRLTDSGYTPYVLQEAYSLEEYLTQAEPRLAPLSAHPDRYADVLFRR